MSAEQRPVAPFCALSSEALRERISMIRREVLPRARARERLADGRAWHFASDPATRETLEELVALERECCADGIVFDLGEHEGGLRLAVRGVDPDAAVFRALEPAATPNTLRRLLGAGGLGVALSAALFCGVPLAVTLWLGAAAAAPLAGLDHPAVIVLAAVAFTATIWTFAKRRAARR